jgi:hypothetical protein
MKFLPVLLAASLSSSAFAAAPAAPAAPKDPHAGMALPANPHAGMGGSMGAPMAALSQQGTVLSSIDVPQYTYIEVRQDKQTRWLAASTVAVKKGDVIRFDNGMPMANFYSKTLKRSFPSISFVNKVEVGGKQK